MKAKFKKLGLIQQKRIESEICMMLHASRDCLRNQGRDTLNISYDVTDGYFGEAFGVMRGLMVLGYGDFGPVNVPNPEHSFWNLKWWFSQLEDRVLNEEGFYGNHQCDHCLERYAKDDTRKQQR